MPEPLSLRLLRRLHQSPYARPLRGDWRVQLHAGKSWLLFGQEGRFGVREGEGLSDSQLHCTPEDLELLLTGQPPTQKIRLLLGERSLPPRRAQAHGLCVAAALGWAGPWPDPEADAEHQRLYRRALLDLRFGVEDQRGPLFPPEAGIPAELRLREELAGTLLCTEGCSDRPEFPEFWLRLPPRQTAAPGIRLLRAAVLAWMEAPFRSLEGMLRLKPEPMPLPRELGLLMEVCAD